CVAEIYGSARIGSEETPLKLAILARIPSRHALGDVAEDFVRGTVRQFGVLEGVDAESIGDSQQDHFIAYTHARNSGHVHQRQVHRDAAHDRCVMVPYDHASAIRKLAIVSVSVAP